MGVACIDRSQPTSFAQTYFWRGEQDQGTPGLQGLGSPEKGEALPCSRRWGEGSGARRYLHVLGRQRVLLSVLRCGAGRTLRS